MARITLRAPELPETRTQLSELIARRRLEIAAGWEAALARVEDPARPALRGRIHDVLDRVAGVWAALASGGDVEVPQGGPDGDLAWQAEPAQLVVELCALRDCIAHVCMPPPMDVRELQLLDRAMDVVIASAIELHARGRERARPALEKLANVALESKSVAELLRRLVAVLLEITSSVDTAAILLVEGDSLVVRAAAGLGREIEEGLTLKIGEGFAGAVAALRRPLSYSAGMIPVLKSPILRASNIRAMYGLPLIDNDQVVGVAHVSSTRFDKISREDLLQFAEMVTRATSAIVQHMLREAAERASAELAQNLQERKFLDDATRVLSSSLNYYDTLEKIAHLAVPALADWCVVDLVEDSAIRRVAIVHSDPARIAIAHEWARKYPVDRDSVRGVAQVIRSGTPEVASYVTAEMIEALTQDPEQLAALRELGLRSYLIVPLRARERTLGTISLVSAESARAYDEADVELAQELANRAGMAVDNARLYHEAQQAVRVRENTLAIVSHDLRNPLGAIDLSASMLIQAAADDRQRKHLEIIRRAADRMEHLIRDLLDMASIHAGRLAIDRKPEDAATLLGEVIDTSTSLATEKGIEICGDLKVDGLLEIDRNRITQVLGNLIGNAVKFCKAGDRIDVRACSDREGVEIEICDSGPGISAEDLPHIFEPYWSAKRHSQKGTGLGLFISKGIVEAHGGRLSVASTLGTGTCFKLWVPRAKRG
jgi:signal transduction histidine kinase/putative methionine-R-sulfoxide reductase with GAF domain